MTRMISSPIASDRAVSTCVLRGSVRRGLVVVTIALSVALGASAAEEPQTDVRIASDGKGFVAIWKQGDFPAKLVLSRVSAKGVRLDETPVVVADNPGDAGIVFGGSSYLVLWTGRFSRIPFARRLSVDGSWLDEQPIAIPAADVYGLGAVWDCNRFFMVWAAGDRGVGGMFGAFLEANGKLTEAKKLSPQETYFEGGIPQVLWNGRFFLVSWSVYVMCDPCGSRYMARSLRVSPEGEPLDLKTPWLLPDASELQIRFASDGVSFLGLSDRVEGGSSFFAVETGGERLQLGALRRLFSWFTSTASDWTWDGASYVVASRFNESFGLYRSTGRPWLSLTRLSSDGTVQSRLVMELTSIPLVTPQLAVNAIGDTVIAIAEVSPNGVWRIQFHIPDEMHPSPLPPDAPSVISAVKSGDKTRVLWTSTASEIDGFVFEDAPYRFNPYDRALLAVDSSTRSADVPTWLAPLLIRSFNSGGMSAAVPIVPAPVRQRVARH